MQNMEQKGGGQVLSDLAHQIISSQRKQSARFCPYTHQDFCSLLLSLFPPLPLQVATNYHFCLSFQKIHTNYIFLPLVLLFNKKEEIFIFIFHHFNFPSSNQTHMMIN